MRWGEGLSTLPDIEGIDDWADPPVIEEPPGTRRRMRSPQIERNRPRYEAELGDPEKVEAALDEDERRAEERLHATLGAPSPEVSEYLQRGTLLGEIRKGRAEQSRTSATTGEYLGLAGGLAGYSLGGLPGLAAEEAIGQGIQALTGKRPTLRSRDAEGNVKRLGAEELAYAVGPDVVLRGARPLAKGIRGVFKSAGKQTDEGLISVFHATDAKSATNIRTKGFNKGAFLATDPEEARLHAVEKRGLDAPEVIGFKVRPDQIQQSKANPIVFRAKDRISGQTVEDFAEKQLKGAQEFNLRARFNPEKALDIPRQYNIAFPRTRIAGGAPTPEEEPLSDIERLLQQSLEAGPQGARTQGAKAARAFVDDPEKAAARAVESEQYAAATRLSRKAAQLAGEAPETTRKRAISRTAMTAPS